MRLTPFLLIAVGCYSETDFTPARTTAYCAAVLACTDPAVLAFDGVDATTCEGIYGPRFQTEGEDCKLDRKVAKACVSGLEALAASCPDGAIDDNLPVACESAFKKCPIGVTPDGDTDLASETGF